MIWDADWRDRHVLNPLFWQRADGEDAIRNEMEKMKACGINDCILEARPHPEYLRDGWWRDLKYILDQARRLDMKIWIFDDGDYPSGTANGEVAQKYPEHTKKYWVENHMDASGPLPHAHFLVEDWLGQGETLYRVLAARRTDRGERIESASLMDLTDRVEGGRLYWPVPEGEWRVFVIKVSPHGQEAHTRNYVDPLSRESVGKYIELVHERHYARFPEEFGRGIAGFFTDEPRFGNITGYDRIVGKSRMPLPYTPGLEEDLAGTPLGRFETYIPLLWYEDMEGICHDARYAYMDAVSRRFADCFTGMLGDWCRSHGARLIGHLVEENGAHARLGYGAGHYFRAMEGLDASGLDVVCNLFPEQVDGVYSTAFNEFDCDFSHWGLARMASSAAQIDPKKEGRALCEAFGAYGWGEGLRVMKWITDHLAVQGVNIITPHAFSPSPFPDPDCPPHFYARGQNPQFRHFPVWSRYACRLLGLLTGARHVSPAAVVYHAEAEWGGACQPFEKAVKALARRQIDCEVLPIDLLVKPESRAENGVLSAGGLTFRALVVPYSQFLPPAFAEKLVQFCRDGLAVYFTEAMPERAYFGGKIHLPGARAVKTEELANALHGAADVACDPTSPDLLYSHWTKDGKDIYFFVNQSTRSAVDTCITFHDSRAAAVYDPMSGRAERPRQDENRVRLALAPWESRAVVFGENTEGLPEAEYPHEETLAAEFSDGWAISIASSAEYPHFTPTPFTRTGDMARPGFLPDFSGTLRYERTFPLEQARDMTLDLGDAYEAVSVWINGIPAGEMICPPYRVRLGADMLRAGENRLRIEVTNTLVKAQHRNPFDRYFPQDPTGLVESVKLYTR